MTTVLTIYSFGLRGNSAYKSIRKHRFWTQKPRKAPEIKEKIGADLFGSKMLQVRVLSLRPPRNHSNNKGLGGSLFLFTQDSNQLTKNSKASFEEGWSLLF